MAETYKDYLESMQDKLDDESVRLAVYGTFPQWVYKEVGKYPYLRFIERRQLLVLAIVSKAATMYQPETDGSFYEYLSFFLGTASRLLIQECKHKAYRIFLKVNCFYEEIADAVKECGGDMRLAADFLMIDYHEAGMKKAVLIWEEEAI